MSEHTQNQAGESFQERLQRLRIKINSLPEPQRPHLYDLAESIARYQLQLQNRVSHDYGAE